jgi:phage protein D
MATSSNLPTEGVLRLAVTSQGLSIPDSAPLTLVSVRSAINQVPLATLVFEDGDTGDQTFSLSDSADFEPGAAIEITAGQGDTGTKIFSGIVVRHGLSITAGTGSRLTVECRDKAVSMTVGRKNAQYLQQSDADVITRLIQAHGLTAKVASTTAVHDELVRHDCTDWDYLLARAEANGRLVVVSHGTAEVAAPPVSGAAVLTVEYGADLIEFEANVDSSLQSAEAPPLDSGLLRLRGRMRVQGSARVEVGTLVDVKGVGKRFSGAVFVTGVEHHFEAGAWMSEIEFGLPAAWFANPTTTPAANTACR